ncbi:MAG: glycosyltransferase family 4 protein [Parasphingorhabdus sp.]|uniref:glycosyltransferase family 4 protein n=1 Tax=Parasphingorhabdus sp. TaxID=2709688 RepID=UPI003299129B
MTKEINSNTQNQVLQGISGPIAYLTSQYPAPSHTFIRREITQLRKIGVDIQSYSIRKPVAGLDNNLDLAAENETYYVLGQSAATYLTAHCKAMFTHPVRYLRTLKKSIQHRVPGFKAFIWSLFHFAESIVLADQLRKDKIVHLHNHFANPAANVGMLAAEYNQMPWSLTLHGISETDYPAGLLLSDKIAAAKFIACVSWFGRAQAMRICASEHWHKFHTVRCGISLDNLPVKPENSSNDPEETKTKQIICVARLSSEKGLPGLLQAFAGIRSKGLDVELSLLGDGPEQNLIEAECRNLGIEPWVHLLGRRSETETLAAISQSDLLVLPSFMEGLPVVLMEAMALNVPVISSRIAGVPELIEDGESGLLFDPANWSELEEKLVRCLSDEIAAKNRAKNANQTIHREFNIEVAISSLPKLFSDAISDHKESAAQDSE